MGDENSIYVFQQELEEHLNLYLPAQGRHYEDVKRSSRIIYDPTDVTHYNNQFNIDYNFSGSTDAEAHEARIFSVTF